MRAGKHQWSFKRERELRAKQKGKRIGDKIKLGEQVKSKGRRVVRDARVES